MENQLPPPNVSPDRIVTPYHAPLPDVETLRGYGELIENGPERLMKCFENEVSTRQGVIKSMSKIENRDSWIRVFNSISGSIILAGFLAAPFGLSYIMATMGYQVASIIALLTAIGSVWANVRWIINKVRLQDK